MPEGGGRVLKVISFAIMCLLTFALLVLALLLFNAERYGLAVAEAICAGFGAGLCFAALIDWFILD